MLPLSWSSSSDQITTMTAYNHFANRDQTILFFQPRFRNIDVNNEKFKLAAPWQRSIEINEPNEPFGRSCVAASYTGKLQLILGQVISCLCAPRLDSSPIHVWEVPKHIAPTTLLANNLYKKKKIENATLYLNKMHTFWNAILTLTVTS